MPRTTRLLTALLVLMTCAALRPGPAGAFTTAEAQAPMTVTLVRGDAPGCGADCPEWLALTGKIVHGSENLLAAALARLGQRRVPILLDSPGGETGVGLAMGRMIRAHRFDTAVAATVLTACDAADRACQARLRAGGRPGHIGPAPGTGAAACASACAFVLAGGVDRAVAPGAYVGVHQAMRVLTFHPVMNTFRILRRTAGGRTVEISRTLVASRALPVRVVKAAAPASLYSEFERFLLTMGVDGSIMPLMRATAPSGIHWLTPLELAATRIANDTTAPATLVARETAAQADAAAHREVRLLAGLTLSDARRWTGGVTWRIDATVPGAPALVGDWEIPERHLRGSVAVSADAAPGTATSFKILTRFASDAVPDAADVLKVQAPELCDALKCVRVIAGDPVFGRPTAAAFAVSTVWRETFLKDLRQLAWFHIVVRTDEGFGAVDLPLASPEANAVTEWGSLCCAFAATDVPLSTPATVLPAFPVHPENSIVAGIGLVRPATNGTSRSRRTLDLPALFDAAPMQQHGFPKVVRGSMTWFPLATAATGGGPGSAVLLGSAELPAAGLRVSIEVSASKADVLGRLTVRLHTLTGDPASFGPLQQVFAFNGYDAQSHPSLLVDGFDALSTHAEETIHIDVPASGPIAGAFQVGFEDMRGRRITLAFPFDPAIAALLQAASRQGPAGAS